MNISTLGHLFVSGAVFFALFSGAKAADTPMSGGAKGFVDLSGYFDTRKFSLLTVNTLVSYPTGYEYFFLVDYSGTPATGRGDETENFYTEQNLRWPVRAGSPFSMSTQWVGQSGPENDLLRAGLLIRLSEVAGLKPFLDGQANSFSINVFPIQLDRLEGHHWQVEYFYRLQVFSAIFGNRVYLSGFADQNIDNRTKSTWVTEHQLGVNFYGSWYTVAEIRYNQYLEKVTGGAFGLQYLSNIP